ncbi:MAG TPA: RagB/SusD family nutrient uptake outer membrane protein [Mucilaginibacter sp.]|nr:RagB/SusD family nutrient uptake outer membrane protein [Mucilaginibacter sp.]
MKKSIFKLIVPGALIFLTISYSCKKYLNQPLVNALSPSVLATKAGVDGLLIGAYAALEMNANITTGETWGASPSNWHFGGIASDDANKGSNATDQPPAAAIMNHSVDPSNSYIIDKWSVVYDGIQRANDVLREIPLVKDGSLSSADAAEITGEARFIRGVFHLEAAKIWRNVPYVDESVTYSAGNYNVGNPGPIWDKIEADFTAAMNALPATQSQLGRANKYAAEAFLARTLMFDHKYSDALTALTDLTTNGETSGGQKYALNANFTDNFNASMKNGPEAVFAIQMAVHDGSNGANGNPGDILNFPAAGPTTCCGFYQPSFSLVNAFKVNPANGLPFINTDGTLGSYDYDGKAIVAADAAHAGNPGNTSTLKSDQGVLSTDATYFPDTTTPVDSRLDWTAGRRGIPFLDYGIMPGSSWARAQGDAGPYINVKNVYRLADAATQSETYGGWAPGQASAMNFNMIRYSDVILMKAECEVEAGQLAAAQADVNLVRARAANPAGWVYGRLTGYTGGDAGKPIVNNALPAANYMVGLYGASPGTSFAANGQAYARAAVWYERRLELAMEGIRFFDLQRYDGLSGGPAASGYMATTLNAYIKTNTSYPALYFQNTVLQGAVFTQGRNEIYPLPQSQIDIEQGALKQNPGY